MANPQKEHGHSPIANELMDELGRLNLNGTQFRLLLVILRKTYGWQKKMDTISLLQFCAATGLSKKLVSRELNRLARRNIILTWGDDHHPKQYGLQKDYARWLTEDPVEVSTDWGTPSEKVSPKNAQSVPQSVDKVSPNQGTTKAIKAKGSESHDSAVSGTLRERFERRYHDEPNKIAVIGELFFMLLGSTPDHRRLGSMSKELNSGGKLMDLIIEASRQRISDDPHDYLAAMVRRVKTEIRPGMAGQSDLKSGKRRQFVK